MNCALPCSRFDPFLLASLCSSILYLQRASLLESLRNFSWRVEPSQKEWEIRREKSHMQEHEDYRFPNRIILD